MHDATPPRGLIFELATPLHPDGALDEVSLGRLVGRVISQADGILAGSPDVGEALELSGPTRRRLSSALLTAGAGRAPLFFGITGHTAADAQELAAAVHEECRLLGYGGQVFLVDLPLWYHSNRGLPQACQRLLEGASRPLILLNLPRLISRRAPVFKRRNIRTHVFKKLAALPSVVGLIHQGDMRRFLNYHGAAARRPEFAFYEADEANFLARPGAWGMVSPGAQLFPALWSLVTRFCLHPEEVDGDPALQMETWNLSQRLQKLSRAYRERPAALLKGALTAQGIFSSATLAPGTPPASPGQQEALLALLDSLDQ